MSSYGGGGIPFPGSQQPQYVNPNAGYGASPLQYGGQMPQMSQQMPQMSQMPQMGMMPPAPAPADPYANAKPGTIAYAKSEGPDGIATYTPVIAQETFYQTPTGPTRGIKWVTATSSQASAAGIPSGAITAANAAQLPQTAGMMPPISMPPGSMPPGGMGHPGMPPGGGYPASPGDDYPVMKPGMTQREYDKAVKRWEKERKRARKDDKERKRDRGDRGDRGDRDRDRDRERDREQWGEPQDPYDIAGGRGDRQRRMSTGAGLGGFERARRISGGAMLRDDDLNRKLESLDMSFNSRRERRMSGGAAAYAPSTAGGFRSRKNSMSEAGRDRDRDRERKISGNYDYSRQSFYPPAGAGIPGGGGYGAPIPGGYGAGARSMPGSPVRPHSAFAPATHHDDIPRGGPSPRPGYYSRSRHASPSMGTTNLPGGYGGPSYGGARDPASASAYPYGAERTPYSTVSNLPPAGDNYALTRRQPSGAPSSLYPVSGRELNRAQPFTAFEEFFLVEDLRELMQPQPPPLPAALVPHDVMAEEWDRCMQGLISLTSQALQSQSSRGLDPLCDLITQWNNTFFLPRGVDISIYKGNSRRSGPNTNLPSTLRAYDEFESEDESSSSSSSSTSESEDDRYFSSARREQKAAKRAERKARRKERQRRRRARRRERSASIRIRAVPLH